jgi:hypothetical protein
VRQQHLEEVCLSWETTEHESHLRRGECTFGVRGAELFKPLSRAHSGYFREVAVSSDTWGHLHLQSDLDIAGTVEEGRSWVWVEKSQL